MGEWVVGEVFILHKSSVLQLDFWAFASGGFVRGFFSNDGSGIKQEDVYYQRYETVAEAKKCLGEFILWYNYERLHQSLDYRTPHQVYRGL